MWPVGAYIAVVAPDTEKAVIDASEKLYSMDFDPDTLTLMEVLKPDEEKIFVIADGEY